MDPYFRRLRDGCAVDDLQMPDDQIGFGGVVIFRTWVGGWIFEGVVAQDNRTAGEIGDRYAPGNRAGSEHGPVGDEQALIFAEADDFADGPRGQEGHFFP